MKTKGLSAFLGGGLLAVMATGAGASGFKYSYGEVGYSHLDSDPFDGAKGAAAELSISAGDHVYLKGGYAHYNNVKQDKKRGFPSYGTKTLNFKIDSFTLGIGGHVSVAKKIDLTGTLSYVDNEFTGDSNTSDRGYEVEAGARVQALKKLEVTPSLVKLNIDNYDSTGYSLGLVYALNKKFALRTRLRRFSDDDLTDFFAGVRLNF